MRLNGHSKYSTTKGKKVSVTILVREFADIFSFFRVTPTCSCVPAIGPGGSWFGPGVWPVFLAFGGEFRDI
jgi:hypothetical protein